MNDKEILKLNYNVNYYVSVDIEQINVMIHCLSSRSADVEMAIDLKCLNQYVRGYFCRNVICSKSQSKLMISSKIEKKNDNATIRLNMRQ